MSRFNRAVALLKRKRVAALLFLIAVPTCAFAKDLELLAKLLSGSFLAQQGVAICSTGDVPFSSEDLSTISKLNSHVDYMKSRITESLLSAEQMAVLREAADRAKAQMSEVIRLLKSNPPDVEQAKRIKWCKGNLIAIAKNRLLLYEENRGRLEDEIEKAKRQ